VPQTSALPAIARIHDAEKVGRTNRPDTREYHPYGTARFHERNRLMGLTGRWRIVEMGMWDSDAIDLLGPGFIEFDKNSSGWFQFVAVQGQMDCREEKRDGRVCVEFTWEGHDDSDPASGRGWAALADNGTLDGHIYIHNGDDSSFRAMRA
jgi:hypothetical protein